MKKIGKLLLIYYNFPPVKTPGAVRVFFWYRSIRPYFQSVFVFTSANRKYLLKDKALETHSPNIIEIPTFDLRTLRLIRSNKPYLSSGFKKNRIVLFLSRLLNSVPFNLLLGDGGLIYLAVSYHRAKKLIRSEGITHIVSFYRPYSDHFVAYLLKRKFPKIYWIADFQDLHVDPILKNVLFPGWQEKINTRIFRKANLLTTVSKGLAYHLRLYHRDVAILYNTSNEPEPGAELFPVFTLTYTGSLYGGKRDPSLIFQALRTLIDEEKIAVHQCRLVYAGPDSSVWNASIEKYGLSHWSQEVVGPVSWQEARALQKSSHINIMITWSSDALTGVLSGKLFEYLASGRPVLGIVHGPWDPEVADLLGNHPQDALMATETGDIQEELKGYILRVYEHWQDENIDFFSVSRDNLPDLNWDRQMRRLINRIG